VLSSDERCGGGREGEIAYKRERMDGRG